MRILTIHADYLDVFVKERAIKQAEEVEEKRKEEHFDECLVVFTSFEEGDGKGVVKKASEEIINIAKQACIKLLSNPVKDDYKIDIIECKD